MGYLQGRWDESDACGWADTFPQVLCELCDPIEDGAIGDVIALMYNLLSGELTLRFILKMLTIAVIAGTTVTFYLWDIRADEQGPGA